MIGRPRDYPKRLLEWWVASVQRHASLVIIITILATGGILFYSIDNFKINVDTSGMISEKLPFRKIEKDFSRAFPELSDTIVVVIDADTAERALSSRTRMAERLRKETAQFKTVYEPGGGDFFEKNGLLYLNVKELEDFADNIATVQPLFAILSQDLSLRGLFSVLEKALSTTEDTEALDKRIDLLFGRMSEAFESVVENRPYQLSWQGIMLGEEETVKQKRQFIILRPSLDLTKLSAAEVPLETVRRIVTELGINRTDEVRVHITGDVALSHENLLEVRNSVGAATLISLLLVAVTLYIGLGRSGRLVFASLATLLIGLIWTTGFAIAFIGSLNLISVTFAVLFIGLGLDYSIQFCLRHRELEASGLNHREGIITTARGVGRSLLVSCVTIAIGFYSFVPTAYAGVGELGLISGTGMFISFFANLTVLPALLTLFPIKGANDIPLRAPKKLLTFPYRHSKGIGIAAVLLGAGAALFFPGLYFDYNPLNLYDRKSEAISIIKELFKDPDSPPWTISVLAGDAGQAKELTKEMGKLKEVKMAISLPDFVPEDQSEKLGTISNIALYMPPKLNEASMKPLRYDQKIEALNSFENTLKKSLSSASKKNNASARRLYDGIERFKTLLTDPERSNNAFAGLEKSLLFNLPELFKRLETSLQATEFNASQLPQELVNQYRSVDGRYRVQVFPSEDIMNRDALERFVKAVRTAAPDATDAPISVYESGKAVASSFRQATFSALVVITIYLLIELRSLAVTVLILIPLILALLLTTAGSVLLGIPINFANVIVVPLLLGVGVHSGIIFILRYKTEPPEDGNMLKTSTARAVLLSTLTLIISTSSLSFSSHRGIASMGILLTLCLGFLILCILVLLPALLELSKDRLKIREGESKKEN